VVMELVQPEATSATVAIGISASLNSILRVLGDIDILGTSLSAGCRSLN
jgi:hypothetical protein